MNKVFVKTNNVKNFIGLVENLVNKPQNIPKMGLVYGEPGLGKTQTAFGDVNVPGVVLHENSNVANAMINSPEMDNFIKNNYSDLKSGKEISGSFRFGGFTNLHNAFGSVDVLSAKAQGDYVDITVLDTYDFNKDDPCQNGT